MKEKILISLSVIAILIGITYISMLPPRNADTLDFETVLKAEYSGIAERKTFVINTKEDWEIFSKDLKNGAQNIKVENIAFDEDKYTFIAVTMGENQTTGYDIEIKEVYEFEDYIGLYVSREIPCAGCPLESKITRPFHVIKILKTNKQIRR
ncbi:MAG: protease complex subunit PrcB family protein [Candidatus Methanofastidiosum sp.]|nr:protease complex subunit PrcB family protein [Methanofastidiosum sp.]NYT14198.1 protease complex subunit PrcB family protein [Candidatus Methanofastidiosa archaeon]